MKTDITCIHKTGAIRHPYEVHNFREERKLCIIIKPQYKLHIKWNIVIIRY